MNDHHRSRALAALLITTAAVAVGLVILHRLAAEPFPPPPGGGRALLRWSQTTPPTEAAGSVLRLGALAVGWYLLVSTAVGLGLRLLRLRRATAVADRLTLPPLRSLLRRAAGVGLAAQIGLAATSPLAGAATATMQAAPATEAASSVTMRRSEVGVATLARVDEAPSLASATLARQDPVETTLRAEPAPAATLRRADAPQASMQRTPGPTASLVRADGPSTRTWVVRPGDHLWGIAEVVVALDRGQAGDAAEVGACWQQLVERNRDRLVVPGDPDLLLPGQVLELPDDP